MNMAHVEDLLYYESKSTFDEDINNGEILNTSIAFIASEGTIYNRGHYFGKQTPPDANFSETSENSLLNKTVTGAINLINNALTGVSESIDNINDNLLLVPKNEDLSEVAYSGDYNDLINTPEIPGQILSDWDQTDITSAAYIKNKPTIPLKISDLIDDSDFASTGDSYTKAESDAKYLTEHQSLNDYATKEYLNSKFEDVLGVNAEGVAALKALTEDDNAATGLLLEIGKKANTSDLASVATSGSYTDLSNKPSIPTSTSQLTNDSGFLTEHQSLSEYYTKTEVDTKIADAGTFDPTLYYTKTQVDNLIPDISGKANTSDLSAVATSGSYNDLSNKPSIPSKVSDLNNDSSFISEAPDDGNKYVRQNKNWVLETSYSNASSSVDGLMSSTDKLHLDTLYNLIDADNPSDGIINKYNEIVDFLDGIDPEGNTLLDIIDTIPTENATTTSDGLMSKEDKLSLDNLNTTVNNIVSFPEAPNDGNKYVRLNKNWVQETSYSNVTISENGLMLATDKAWLENFKNYNSGCNSNADITAITNTKKLSMCSVSANATLGLSGAIPTDYANELHILIHNTGSSSTIITIPSTLASITVVNMMDENLEISSGKWAEINILTDGSTYYVRFGTV